MMAPIFQFFYIREMDTPKRNLKRDNTGPAADAHRNNKSK